MQINRRGYLREVFCACLFFSTLSASGANEGSQPKGLYVKGGVLMRRGHSYSGIGANYDTLFGRLLQGKSDSSSLDNLALLGDKGIPFVRFRACGFSPRNVDLYLKDRSEYFRRMDQVVRCAEQHHIGLIPSLFWRLATVSEVVGEAPNQLGDPRSKAIAFIKQYTAEMVGRYKDSPAIWGWEFGNEANLGVDLPRSGTGGGRSLFSGGDGGVRLTTDQLGVAYTSFARVVRSIDPSRVIDSGTTIPRPAGWHNANGQPRERDSEAQSYAILSRQNPDPLNLLSVHIYQKSQKLQPYGPESVGQFISRYARYAAKAGKPLFIGEFPTRDRSQTNEYLQAIKDNHVPLSAFWTFDNSQQDRTMNVTFQNERSFVIDLVVKANQGLHSP
ncbi:MAG: cellulase family glycosylhydrolase [Chthoniobacterales bacterium]